MKCSTKLKSAEKHRKAMQLIADSVAFEIKNLIGDDGSEVEVFYQIGDGWVVLFRDVLNAKLNFDEFDKLLRMNRTDALEFLSTKTI